ncbi:MAG: hypothetical protein GF368_05020 [Candidatus Aenigmarchaeota archaeon]|nr:hypothetical protein [Candidatus Aenigmarchaeota archaeon]
MNLSDILLLTSVVGGLLSIPFIVTGPLSDNIPTGEIVLGMEANDVENIPNKMTKVFSSERYEKTYETAFGRFILSIASNEVSQELSKPGMVTQVTEDIEKTVWKITTQQYSLEVIRTPDSVTQTCTTPDGELIKIKQRGEVTETFQGMSQDSVIETCAQAEESLQIEVEKMEQIKTESEIPSTETKESGVSILINEFMSNPDDEDMEWIELYNPGESDLNLTGWTIEDDSASEESLDDFSISANGYLLLNKSDGDFGFGLTNTRDIIILREDGVIVDQVAYGSFNDGNVEDNPPASSDDGNSTARVPDGSDSWQIDESPTPGQTNS